MRTLSRAAAIGALVVVGVVLVAFVIGPMKPELGSPEAAADAVLRELRGGRVDAAVLHVANGGIDRETQDRERQYRLHWWWLVDKRMSKDGVELEYRTLRDLYPLPSPVWIKVANVRGRWRVTGFEAWY